ncbi:MAG TPA: restriction endonuclease subunit S, partial [Verrucomicrobiota bacterium]|nr:restriction endonuclease subunit S [Verrucomicrobiota bacterium]
MAGEWRITTLGEFLTLQRGFDLPMANREEGPYPVIASSGPVGMHKEAMVKGPGVVIGRSGSLGGGQYIQEDFWPLNTTLWVKNFKGNHTRFCYYFLKSMDLGRYNAGSGVPTLNRNHIHPLPVCVPTVNEQQAIACILGALDDKIELNRRMNRTLEEMARAIFKSWFVDFDPVHWNSARR